MALVYSVSEWMIATAFLGVLLGATEAGFRLGLAAKKGFREIAILEVPGTQGAMLGLLGLLLGFTISMAVSRFDLRQQLVVTESNAIGTAWLRTQLVGGTESQELANLLSDYVDARLDYYNSGSNAALLEAATARAEKLHTQIWARGVSIAGKGADPVSVRLLIQSLNDVIDAHAARLAAMENHVPATVIRLVAIVSVLAAVIVGYDHGLKTRRNLLLTLTLCLVITLVQLVILDLDRPRDGFIRVSEQSLVDLKRTMHTITIPNSSSARPGY
jgi:hypothetical protein